MQSRKIRQSAGRKTDLQRDSKIRKKTNKKVVFSTFNFSGVICDSLRSIFTTEINNFWVTYHVIIVVTGHDQNLFGRDLTGKNAQE